ncbi:MAG: substrate-binding domain-containing protein, partial [Leptolyngbyaceae bacterium]|nr:substrate-binding domain-containing protein [Leptolyngbyaceae bacterium]
MDRRSFLAGAGALALTQMLMGCGGQQRPTLKVRLLKNTIPAQLLSKFRQELRQSTQNFALDFKPEAQLKTLFQLLETWNPQSSATASQKPWFSLPWNQKPQPQDLPDLVTLGDYWLTQAIHQQLIQPLNPANLQQWQQLPPRWRELVTRDRQGNLDPKGQVWAAPYRWGSTMIAYRIDKFKALGWTPKDWSDLWRPELRGRISLLDQPREVIGLTLKKLGHSYN